MNGLGSAVTGGRWNSPDVSAVEMLEEATVNNSPVDVYRVANRVVYAASSLALASLEVLVHAEPVKSAFLSKYRCVRLNFDSSLLETLELSDLPYGWNEVGVASAHSKTRAIGDVWLREARSLVLAVPSAVIPLEYNYLINPRHPDFGKIEYGPILPFAYDHRLNS